MKNKNNNKGQDNCQLSIVNCQLKKFKPADRLASVSEYYFSRKLKEVGLSLNTEEGRKAALQKLESELNKFKRGGEYEGMFPERWLPSCFAVLAEPFTEQNKMINSTMKMVRGRIEKAYEDRIKYLYTAEGKTLLNQQNIDALR